MCPLRCAIGCVLAGALILSTGAPTLIPVVDALEAQTGLQLEAIDSPAVEGSAQPQMTVSTRGILLSWVEREGRRAVLKFAERTAAGWTPAREVASGEDWFVNWADVPSVLRLDDGTLVGHWLQKSGSGTYAYDVRLARSSDDGRTWSPSFLPHHDGTQTEHGFASLLSMPGGGLGLVWLDGRDMAAGGEHGAGGHGGAMSIRFGAFDRSWRQVADQAIDSRVCECCPTTAAVTSEGVIVAYRDRSDTEVRDIVVSRLVNGRWSDPVPVHRDNWQINACPVNGPMLATRDRRVALAWFTAVESPRAYVAFSSDAGRTFGAPIRIDESGTLGRVDVALLPNGDAIVSWVEHAAGEATLRVRRITPAGVAGPAVTVAPMNATRASGYPRMAVSGDELIFAWTDVTRTSAGASISRVRTTIARGVRSWLSPSAARR